MSASGCYTQAHMYTHVIKYILKNILVRLGLSFTEVKCVSRGWPWSRELPRVVWLAEKAG